MELVIPVIAAALVGLFAKTQKNRSFIFWSLGTIGAVLVFEIPIRLVLMGASVSDLSKTLTVATVVAGTAFLLACGASRKPKAQ